MISEIDIRDWEKLDVKAARDSLGDLSAGIHSDVFLDDFNNVLSFINQVELLQRKYVKQVPALFKGK